MQPNWRWFDKIGASGLLTSSVVDINENLRKLSKSIRSEAKVLKKYNGNTHKIENILCENILTVQRSLSGPHEK